MGDPDYLIDPRDEEGQQVSGANYWTWNGQADIVYHGDSGRIYARTIDSTLRDVGAATVLYASDKRVAAPDIVTDDGGTYLFFEYGPRLGATIAWAKAGATS